MRSRDALSPGEAAARTRALAQRAGAAWNRHDTAAVRDNLRLAIEMGEARMRVSYGSNLKILHDLRNDDGTLLGAIRRVVVEDDAGDDGVSMDDGQTDEGRPADSVAATAPADTQRLQPTAPASIPQDDGAAAIAARLAALEKKASVATLRNRRQKAARKERQKAVRLLAAQASSAEADARAGVVPASQVHCPLWSTTLGQEAAMMRLTGVVTERCAAVARKNDLSTKAVRVQYGGRSLEATVLSGTAAVAMTESKRGEELLALLGSGLTEVGISALLNRWSQTAVQGSPPAPRSTSGMRPAFPAMEASHPGASAFLSPFGPPAGK